MPRASIMSLAAALAGSISLAACGGGSARTMPTTVNYNLQAGITDMVAHGLTANVTLSGTVLVNGASTQVTGTGTYTRAAAVNTTFNGTAALAQAVNVAGTVSAAGQSSPYSTMVTEYYAASNNAFLGENDSSEYDVAQSPFEFPTMVVGGSAGTLGTVSRYTDSTMSVSLGTAQVSYSVMAPVDPGSPIGVAVTNKIFNTQNALVETDVTNYTMTSSNVISFASATAQNQSGTLTLTAH